MNKKEIKYKVTLEHDDFVLLVDILKKGRDAGLINWDAAGFVCQNATVEEQKLAALKTVRIFANVNPLEPNTLQLVDCSSSHCCAVSRYLSDVMPKQVRILKDKGFKVRVQVSELANLDVDNI